MRYFIKHSLVSKKKSIILTISIGIFFIVGSYLILRGFIYKNVIHAGNFFTSRYAPYAYQIAPDPVAKEVLTALRFFEIKKSVLRDSSLEVKIRPHGNYNWKTFILKKHYTLYLAIMPDTEGEFNDTSNFDYLNYDIPILVDSTGTIVNNP